MLFLVVLFLVVSLLLVALAVTLANLYEVDPRPMMAAAFLLLGAAASVFLAEAVA